MEYARQIGIFDPREYQDKKVTVIGVGAVGSFITIALAKMGISNIDVYDHDRVEEHNLPNQFYRSQDLGSLKVDALEEIVRKFTGGHLGVHPNRYAGERLSGVVIVAVDSMDVRKAIWLHIRRQPMVELLVDIRMGGEVAWMFAIRPGVDNDFYEQSLYSSADAYHAPCSQQSIIYTVLGTACFGSGIIKKYLLNQAYPKELVVDFKLNMIL